MFMTNLTFRPAERHDLEPLLPLFLEMERFYDGDAAVCEPLARDRLAIALDGRPAGIMILALTDRPLGFASIHEMFPGSQLNAMWYLKELFVSADARGQGMGEGLMSAAAKAIVGRGGSRLEFTTEAQNISAQRFYTRMGAREVPKKFYRYEGEALQRLAGQGLG